MPNTNTPQGLVPILRGAGGNFAEANLRSKAATLNARIRIYDAVAPVSDGTISRTITPGTTNLLGVAIDGGAPLTLTQHHVIEEPDATYAAMVSGATGGLAADVFANANLLLGSTSTFISDDQIDQTTIAATATLDLKLIKRFPEADTTFGQFSVFEVQINKTIRDQATAGV